MTPEQSRQLPNDAELRRANDERDRALRAEAEANRHAEEYKARAEDAGRRLAALELITDPNLARLPLDELLQQLLVRVQTVFQSDTANLLLLDSNGDLRVRAAIGLEDEVTLRIPVLVGKGFAGTIAATRRPFVLEHVGGYPMGSPLLQETKVKSLLGVPLLRGSELMGVLHLGTLQQRTFSASDVRLLEVVADRVARAIETAQLIAAEIDQQRRFRQAEQRYRSLVNGLDRSIVWEATADTLWFSFVSMPAETILGYPLGRWFSEPNFFSEILHPDDRGHVLELVRAAQREGSSREARFDHRMLRIDGSAVWMHTGISVVEIPSGTVIHGITMDIDELKRAEGMLAAYAREQTALADLRKHVLDQARGESLANFAVETIARGLNVSFALILVPLAEDDSQLEILAANERARAALASRAIRVTKGSGLDRVLSQGAFAAAHLSSEPELQISEPFARFGAEAFLGVVSGRERFRIESFVVAAYATEPRDFSEADCRFVVQVCDSLVSAREQDRLLAQTDAARREAELARARAATLYEATAAVMSSGTLRESAKAFTDAIVSSMADAEGCLLYLRSGSDDRMHLVALSHRDEDAARVLRRLEAVAGAPLCPPGVLAGGEPEVVTDIHGSFAAILPSERDCRELTSLFQSCAAAPLSLHGETQGALVVFSSKPGCSFSQEEVCVVRELSQKASLALENEQLLEQAQHAARARQDLLAIVSHDLRNPLSAIVLSATALSRSSETDPKTARRVRSILSASESMTRLVSSLLDAASLEAGQFQIHKEPMSLPDVILEAIEMIRPVLAEKSLAIVTRLPSELPKVEADRQRILQVLSNLLTNAVKFTVAGELRVEVEQQPEALVVTVRDTGPGVAPEHLERLFQRYWRPTRTPQSGAGLGLFISKGIVEAHGGRIWAESELGRGSTFAFSIPLARTVAEDASYAQAVPPHG